MFKGTEQPPVVIEKSDYFDRQNITVTRSAEIENLEQKMKER